MLNTIRVSAIIITFLIFIPKVSYAWGDQHGHDRDRGSHQEHGFRSHVNPDLTLVTGMDDIDTRVLVDADPDQASDAPDQSETVVQAAASPAQVISSDADGDFVINVPNNAGGFTPVRIQKWGNGYLGPQGELYYPFPQISQLKAIYGM